MKKLMIAALATLALVSFAGTAAAQQVDAAYTFGKVLDVPADEFTAFHIPEVELRTKGGLKVNARWYFDAHTGERDIQEVSFATSFKINPWSKKLVYSATLTRFDYFVDFESYNRYRAERRGDWTYALSARYPLKR